MRFPLVALLLLHGSLASACLASGCVASHPREVAGIPEDRTLRSLTDAEWERLCQWKQDQRDLAAGELWRYNCADGVMFPIGECPPSGCSGVDWTARACFERDFGSRLSVRRAPVDCPSTVGDYEDCTRLAELRPCGPAIPECLALTCPSEP